MSYPDAVAKERAATRLENLALIAATLGACEEIEQKCSTAIRHFKHRPLLRMYTDDLRRLCELAAKGNQ